jgi:hypothetical protein
MAMEEGHFRKDLDVQQFAFEVYGVALAYHHASRLMQDSHSRQRAMAAAERILADAKARPHH